ncbi:uncharacterized protein A4U43_C01F28010 [Asparagus officinalis]|uniref:Uncharacterized protein n=1 Tax=Asparagus officinalis TaxID=4686 RepID=A0A5P1FUK0_ASPOF|nr:uncharacterized protein A4U43_C01F28010 [Asparagus officinalis]
MADPENSSSSPTSAGFSTDRLPPTTNSYNSDPNVIPYDDVVMSSVNSKALTFVSVLYSDYRRLDEQDQYEPVGLDDSMEDERDLDQIIADRRAAEVELDQTEINWDKLRGIENLTVSLDPYELSAVAEDGGGDSGGARRRAETQAGLDEGGDSAGLDEGGDSVSRAGEREIGRGA